MSPRYAVLSLFALFVICLLIMKNYETWTRPIETAPERTTAKKQEVKAENPPALSPQRGAGPAQSNAIAEKNIFSPDRKDFPVQTSSSEGKAIVRPQVVLYGITIGDGYQLASIVNPGRRLLRGERETLSVKVGDKVGDYKLAKISSDRITLETEGGDVFEVLLYDPKTPKKRTEVRTETKPAAVTSTLPTMPAAEAPKTTPPTVAEKATPALPAVTTRPIAPTQVPRPVLPMPMRRRSRMLYPGVGDPATPSTPAPQPEAEEN